MRPTLDHKTLALMRATSGPPPLRPLRVPAVAAVVIVVVAILAVSPGTAWAAAAGDLDPTFDGDGKAVLPFGAWLPQEALVQPDGKIVLVGSPPNYGLGVWRLNPDGSPDRGFDGDGAGVAHFPDSYATSGALQADGRIVVTGTGKEIARFDGDGSLDESFGPDSDGTMVLDSDGALSVDAVVVQSDGKIAVAGGHAASAGEADFAVTRLRPNGAIDKVFELADFGGDDWVRAAAPAGQDKIVVLGSSQRPGDPTSVLAIARYHADGSLDQSFGESGKTTLGPGAPMDVRAQPDGKVIVIFSSSMGEGLVTRLTSDGKPDATFGAGGTAAGGFLAEKDRDVAAALRPDGGLFVAGTAPGLSAFAIGRLTPAGTPDTVFGSGGSTTISFNIVSAASSAALQPDGKLIVAGATLGGIAVARLLGDPPALPTGSLDPGPDQRNAHDPGQVKMPPPRPRCAGRAATIIGTPGRDRLRGTRRADVIVALGGDDRVVARGGNDVVCGGAGNDTLSGGPGRDQLRGQRGRDRLTGGTGRDTCIGDTGRDRARGCESKRSI